MQFPRWRSISVWMPLAMFAAAALLVAGCPAPTEEPVPKTTDSDAASEVDSPTAPTSLGEVDPSPIVLPSEAAPQTTENDPPPGATEITPPVDTADPVDPATKPQAETEEKPTGGSYNDATDSGIDFETLNGKLFVDWPKPAAALLFSGMQQGYIEPCGCSGLKKKKGGVGRRDTLLKQLADQGWPVAAFDLGGLVRRFGPQAELKYHATTDALQKMGYLAVGFGPHDLRLPPEVLISTIKPGGETHFVSANVGLYGLDSGMTRPYRIVQVGDRKFGVTTVLGESARAKVRGDEIETKPAAEVLPGVLEKMVAEKPDTLVLLVNGEPEEATKLAEQFPKFDVVVSPGHSDPPPMTANKIKGTDCRQVELSHKGMFVGVLAFFDDDEQPVRYQRVPLDGRFKESPRMVQVLTNYQDQLKALGWEGLGIKPLPDPHGRAFIGSQTCADCHTNAHDIWADTPHGNALATLEKLTPPRQFDAECISCHVVGWEPQKYVPFASGFRSKEMTPELIDQGCENCHGGGKQHALIELGELDASDEQQTAARLGMRVSLDTEAGKAAVLNNCMQCHDLDNSPDFDFDTYWPKVEHEGLD